MSRARSPGRFRSEMVGTSVKLLSVNLRRLRVPRPRNPRSSMELIRQDIRSNVVRLLNGRNEFGRIVEIGFPEM